MNDHSEGREEPMDQQTSSGPWEPPPVRPRRRLYRRTDDKMIAGVASGLADYLDVDPVLVRIGFVILAILGGAGIILYGVMWWIVPPVTEVSNAGEDAIRRLKRAPTWVALALVILGAILLASQVGPFHGDLIWGLGLVAIGVLLFWQTTQRGDDEAAATVPSGEVASGAAFSTIAPPPVGTRPSGAPAGVDEPGAVGTAPRPAGGFAPTEPIPPTGGFGEPPGRYAPAPPRQAVPPPRRKRERSGLGLATMGAAFLAVGIAALLDTWGLFDLSLAQYLALALTVLSIGLVIGAWVGRARWLVIPALLLLPFVVLASLVTVPFTGGWGDRHLEPASITRGHATYRMVAGRMRLDLSNLDLSAPGSATPVHVTASMVAGSLEVVVPRGMPVHVDAKVGAGAMWTLGTYDDGFKVQRTAGQSNEVAQLDLSLAVSFGRIVVSRAVGEPPKPVPPAPGKPSPAAAPSPPEKPSPPAQSPKAKATHHGTHASPSKA